jgi:hypothetical protein
MIADHDMVGIAALGKRAVLLVDPVVGADHSLLTEDLPTFLALGALHAAVDHAADRNRVTDLVGRDVRANAVTVPTISWPGTTG